INTAPGGPPTTPSSRSCRPHPQPATPKHHDANTANTRDGQQQVDVLGQQLRQLPSRDTYDPGYRRLRYSRYADDQLFGFVGPKAEAEQIKQQLTVFLRDELKLELSDAKTLVTHARTGKARYLGYDISIGHNLNRRAGRHKTRTLNGVVLLSVPYDVATAKVAVYLKDGKPRSFRHLHHRSDYAIVAKYGAEYRGVVNYYKLAGNLHRLTKLRWAMETSMLKTLAGKHHISARAARRKHHRRIATPAGPRVCFEAQLPREGRHPLTARFGEVNLARDKYAPNVDPRPVANTRPGVELIGRAARRQCELCHREQTPVAAHQVKNLNTLDPNGPAWHQIMIRKHRKTLLVCANCHNMIHHPKPITSLQLESRMR
ncbi:MAG: hypothetical protein FWD59_05005, partial [Micrococcales bacterium]|nr:hypothetical protein [Micrococcales bacterium]